MTLRPWLARDVPALVAACNGDEELAYWLDLLPQPYGEDDARRYVADGDAGWRGEAVQTPFAVLDAVSAQVLGSCGVFWNDPAQGIAEVGYWTGRHARGRGVATRAVLLVARWVLGEVGFERLELRADTRNEASLRVAANAGFTKEGVLRSVRVHARDGRRVDHALFSLLRSELRDQ